MPELESPPVAPEAFTTASPVSPSEDESDRSAGVPVRRVALIGLALAGAVGFGLAWVAAPVVALAGLAVAAILVGLGLLAGPSLSRRRARRKSQRPNRKRREWRISYTARKPRSAIGGGSRGGTGGGFSRFGGRGKTSGGGLWSGPRSSRGGASGGKAPGGGSGSTRSGWRWPGRRGSKSVDAAASRRSKASVNGMGESRRGRWGSAASRWFKRSPSAKKPGKSSPSAPGGKPGGRQGDGWRSRLPSGWLRRKLTSGDKKTSGRKPAGGLKPTGRSNSARKPAATKPAATWWSHMPGSWLRRKSTSGDKSTTGGGKSERAKRAKAKLRQEWWDWWFTPRPGAVPPEPKPPKTSKPTKPQGKKKRASGDHATAKPRPVVDTPHEEPVEDRETLAWLGPSDLPELPYDDCGFPLYPDPTRAPRADSTKRANTTNEAAGIGTGPPPRENGQSVPDVSVPTTAISLPQASAYFLANQRDQEANAQAWATSAQEHRDRADAYAARDAENGTDENAGVIERLRQVADGYDETAAGYQVAADTWGERASDPFGDVKAMTSG